MTAWAGQLAPDGPAGAVVAADAEVAGELADDEQPASVLPVGGGGLGPGAALVGNLDAQPAGPLLRLTTGQWRSFTAATKDGALDLH